MTGAVNAGVIVLHTLDGNDAELRTTNGLVNAPTGVITAKTGAGGARRITGGVLTNRGQVTADTGVNLQVFGTYAADGGWVDGADGSVKFISAVLQQLAVPTHPSLLDLRGFTQLTTDNLAGTTLLVRASNLGSSELRSPAGFTNHGIIVLDSTVGNEATLRTTTGTVVNAPSGVIYSNVGAGGRGRLTPRSTTRGR